MIAGKDEEEVIKMSQEIDSFLFPLHLFSIVLARMTAISNMTEISHSYKRLLEEVLRIIDMRETANTNGNYH
jgi:meiotically up-regulated gene 157 (Mug157) protein